jgi:sialic acid synthase SpsE
MIEKTVTQDKKRKHAEHYMSLELGEIAPFVEQVRQVYQAMGSHTVLFTGRVNPEARRGIYAARNIRKGETIFIHDLAFRRPQGRIPVDRYTEIVGTVAGRDIEEGEEIW